MTGVTGQKEEKKEKEKEEKQGKFLHTDVRDLPKVVQEVLADLKRADGPCIDLCFQHELVCNYI